MRTIKTTLSKNTLTRATLNKILKKATMNQNLRDAITATVEALKQNNIKLAYQLTACKSFICGEINSKDTEHAFQEDATANKKALGDDLYCILDGIHFNLAMQADQMPSGMMAMCAGGKVEEMKHRGTHPIVQLMINEQKALYARS